LLLLLYLFFFFFASFEILAFLITRAHFPKTFGKNFLLSPQTLKEPLGSLIRTKSETRL
jgi:hypothetical protein